MSKTYTLDPVPDLEADFGPGLPDPEGLEGVLRLADPVHSCSPYAFSDFDTVWVALVARQQQFHPALNCTFDMKVRHAQEAGAVAAIVYDDECESLIIMSKPKTHPDPLIPAVFVTEKAGMLMRKLMELEGMGGVRVRITPVSAIAWLSMVMSAVLGLLALTVVFSTFYIMRSWSLWLSGAVGSGTVGASGGMVGATGAGAMAAARGASEGGLPPHVLRALPVLIYESTPPSRARSLPNSLRQPSSVTCALVLDLDAPDASVKLPDAKGPAVVARQAGNQTQQQQQQLPEGERLGGDGYSSNSSECDVVLPPGVHAGETKRLCTVCLETYMDGEKLRVLPCHHRFHMACIDQWLSARRVCPMCKHDCSRPLAHASSPDAQDVQQQQQGARALTASLSARLATVRRAFMSVSAGAVTSRAAASAATAAATAGAGALSLLPVVATSAHAAHDHASGGAPTSGSAAGPYRRGAIRARIIRWMGLRPFQRHAVLSALTPATAGDNDDPTAALADPLLAPAADSDSEDVLDLERGASAATGLAHQQRHPPAGQPLPRQQQARGGAGSSAPIPIMHLVPHVAAAAAALGGLAAGSSVGGAGASVASEVGSVPLQRPAGAGAQQLLTRGAGAPH